VGSEGIRERLSGRADHFDVEPLDSALRCTPQSIASHSLYENADPYRHVESNGTIDLSQAQYAALDDRRVRVRGSQFIPAETYTVKTVKDRCRKEGNHEDPRGTRASDPQ
jgi:hypothetical protein